MMFVESLAYSVHSKQENNLSLSLWLKHFHFCSDKENVLKLTTKEKGQGWARLTVSGLDTRSDEHSRSKE